MAKTPLITKVSKFLRASFFELVKSATKDSPDIKADILRTLARKNFGKQAGRLLSAFELVYFRVVLSKSDSYETT